MWSRPGGPRRPTEPYVRFGGVQEYDPFAPEVMADPLPFYRALRDGGRAHRLEQYDAWAIPRFDDVWQALQDQVLNRSRPAATTSAGLASSACAVEVRPPMPAARPAAAASAANARV